MSYTCYYTTSKGVTYFYAGYIPDDYEDQQEYSNSSEGEAAAEHGICGSISDKIELHEVVSFLGISSMWKDKKVMKVRSKILRRSNEVFSLPVVEFNTDELDLHPEDFEAVRSILSPINYALWIYVNLHSCNEFHYSTEDTRYAQELLEEMLREPDSYDFRTDVVAAESRLKEALFERKPKMNAFTVPLSYVGKPLFI